MSLDSGTPVTSWPIEPTSSELVNGFNRIGGNTQDLEDSKVENAADGSAEVDLSQGADTDAVINTASDATFQWDESADEFVASKPVIAPVGSTVTRGETTIANNARWTPERGVYQIIFESTTVGITTDDKFQIEINANGGWNAYNNSPSSFIVGRAAWQVAIITDGTNIRFFNNGSGGTVTVYYVRFS